MEGHKQRQGHRQTEKQEGTENRHTDTTPRQPNAENRDEARDEGNTFPCPHRGPTTLTSFPQLGALGWAQREQCGYPHQRPHQRPQSTHRPPDRGGALTDGRR